MTDYIQMTIIVDSLEGHYTDIIENITQESSKRGWNIFNVVLAEHFPNADAFTESHHFLAIGKTAILALKDWKLKHPTVTCFGLDILPKGRKLKDVIDSHYDALLENRWSLGFGLLENNAGSFVVTAERGVQVYGDHENPYPGFMDIMFTRRNQEHYQTTHTRKDFPVALGDDVQDILGFIHNINQLSLFPVYQKHDEKYPGAEFGFVAKRTSMGTLVTGRGSNKANPSLNDLALMEKIEDDKILHVVSPDKKASLNAPLAYRIFEERPDIQYIVHSHIFLPNGVTVADISLPGTKSDWLAIQDAVRNPDVMVINQPLHGVLILLKNKEDLLDVLKDNALYKVNSHYYETAYRRFQSSGKPSFFDSIVNDQFYDHQRQRDIEKKNLMALDLCCGTGASAESLHRIGFRHIDLLDGSASMLEQAKLKFQDRVDFKESLFVQVELQNLELSRKYDLIMMRQAFNYLTSEEAIDGFFQKISEHLNTNGVLIFNTFGIQPEGLKPSRTSYHQDDIKMSFAETLENNIVDSEEILHTQRTEYVDFENSSWDIIYDLNIFHQYSVEDILRLSEPYFPNFKFHTDGKSLTFVLIK